MGWHLLLILLCSRHSMDPPFADVLSPIVWKRSRLSSSSFISTSLPISLRTFYANTRWGVDKFYGLVIPTHINKKGELVFSSHGNGEEGDRQAPRKSGLSAFLSIRGEHLAPFPSRLSSIESIRSKCARKGISGDFKRKTFVSREMAHIPKNNYNQQSHTLLNF